MLSQCHDFETALDQRYFYPVFAGLKLPKPVIPLKQFWIVVSAS